MKLNWLEIGIIVAAAVLLSLMVRSGVETVKKRSSFMAECQKDKKAYECEVLVKQAYPGPNVVWVIH